MVNSIPWWSLNDLPLHWPEAHIRLIDALRDYIRSDEAVAKDLLDEGQITRAEYDEGMAATNPMRAMLAELETHEMDPTILADLKKAGK